MTGPGDGPATNSLETQISQNSYCLEKCERIKEHLIEFSGESTRFFTGLTGTFADINAAAQQLQSKNITDPSCTVMKTPSSKDLKWARDVEKRHRDFIANGILAKGLNKTERWMDRFESGEGKLIAYAGNGVGKIAEHSAYLGEHLGSVSMFLKRLGGGIGEFMEDGGKVALKRLGAVLMFAEDMHDGEGLKKSLERTALKVAADSVVDLVLEGFGTATDAFDGPLGTVLGIGLSVKADDYINGEIDKFVG
ncbi:hypothetical protein ACI3E1_04200 [Ligilactobacillus sp. LYQ139]|uniref:hypothetical protein n=1 Tax=Ligilactobacillus sp. LYQ139 TaxID=3378800 RepID=UPI003852AE78